FLDKLTKRMQARYANCKYIHEGFDDDRYDEQLIPLPMFNKPNFIDSDISVFMNKYQQKKNLSDSYENPWFNNTFSKAMTAHELYKKKDYDGAMLVAKEIAAPDWKVACTEWLLRRENQRKE